MAMASRNATFCTQTRQLGRMPCAEGEEVERREAKKDAWGEAVASGIDICGRVVLNAWRCARAELKLTSFTIDAVSSHVLGERSPTYTHQTLTRWWDVCTVVPRPRERGGDECPVPNAPPAQPAAAQQAKPKQWQPSPPEEAVGVAVCAAKAEETVACAPSLATDLRPVADFQACTVATDPASPLPNQAAAGLAVTSGDASNRAGEGLDAARLRVLRYYALRVRTTLRLVASLELISRTSELARVFGIDFLSVLTRGSQFRVESMLLRLARTQHAALPSMTKAQVRRTSWRWRMYHPSTRGRAPPMARPHAPAACKLLAKLVTFAWRDRGRWLRSQLSRPSLSSWSRKAASTLLLSLCSTFALCIPPLSSRTTSATRRAWDKLPPCWQPSPTSQDRHTDLAVWSCHQDRLRRGKRRRAVVTPPSS